MAIGAFVAIAASAASSSAKRSAAKRAGRRRVSSLERAQGFIREGTSGARGELETGFSGAEDSIKNALEQALGVQGAGIEDIMAALQGGTENAIGTLREGEGRGIDALLQSLMGAEGRLDPFASGGEKAFQNQLALSGSLGPEAQAKAFEDFKNSPGQDFFRDQGEQSIARMAAASGGLEGGALKADLLEFGTGIAQQNFDKQFAQLGQLAGRGQQAATTLGQFGMDTGRSVSDLIRGTSSGVAGLESGLGQMLAQALGVSTRDISALFTNSGNQMAGLNSDLGANLANLLLGQGTNLANLEQGIGTAQANAIINSGNATAGFFDDAGSIYGGIGGGGGTPVSSSTMASINSHNFDRPITLGGT